MDMMIASLPEDFEKFRNKRNAELEQRFSRIFESLVYKYATLHKNVMYKKTNKMSFIRKQSNNNSILSVLNKLTNSNATSLSEKIMARCNTENVALLVQQTLEYASNSTIDACILETLLVGFMQSYPDNEEIREEIEQYVNRFFNNLELCEGVKQDENYEDFLHRNVRNNRIKGAAKMISVICASEGLSYMYEGNICHLVGKLAARIDKVLEQRTEDNLTSLLMECLLIMIKERRLHSSMQSAIEEFRSYEFRTRIEAVSNKHRFLMYDIFEAIEKIEQNKIKS